MLRMPQIVRCLTVSAVCGLVALGLTPAVAVPITYAEKTTLSEDVTNHDVTVIATLVERPAKPPGNSPDELYYCTFEIVRALKGAERLERRADGQPPQRVPMLYYGEAPLETQFLSFGIVEEKELIWGTPIPLTDASIAYMHSLGRLPKSRPERLRFFLDYFEHAEQLLACDAYDEFEHASYVDLVSLKDRLSRERLWAWIQDPAVGTSHKRLYLHLLSVCGSPDDLPRLEAIIRNEDRDARLILSEAIGCYLLLKGATGLPLIEQLFLKNQAAAYTDVWAAIMAVRIVGHETQVIPRERLADALRLILENPKLADMVVPDLQRWEDWSVIDKLAHLFRTSDPESSSWIRVPVLQYLRACPLPEAKLRLKELEKLDPDAARRADLFKNVVPAAPAGTGSLIRRYRPGFC